jgi:hypothetical protein
MSAAAEEVLPNNELIKVENFPVNYDVTPDAIAALRAKYGDLTKTILQLDDKAGYAEVKDAITEIRGLRLSVEGRRKEYKAGVILLGKKIDGTANSIKDPLAELEDALKLVKEAVDDENKRIKEEEVLKEKARIEAIQSALAELGHYRSTLTPNTAAAIIEGFIKALDEEHPITEELYQEFLTEADNTKTSELLALKGLLSERKEWEAAEQHRKEEDARLAAERKKMDDEKAAMEKEMAKMREEKERMAREKRDAEIQQEATEKAKNEADERAAAEAVERKRIENETAEKLKAEAEEKERLEHEAEKQRIENEAAAAAAEKEAEEHKRLDEEAAAKAMPDKTKLIEQGLMLREYISSQDLTFATIEAQEAFDNFVVKVAKCSDFLEKSAREI